MIEYLVLPAILFLAAVILYYQRRDDITILQVEDSQVQEQLAELLQERQPLVIRGVQPPKGLTREGLQAAPRLEGFPVGGKTLSEVLANPSLLATAAGLPTCNRAGRLALADELSFPVWVNHVWLPLLSSTTWTGWATGCMRTEAVLGGLGMWRTTGLYTLIIPTEGTYTVSVLSKSSEAFLPTKWHYRYLTTLTPNDTPLVSDLKYLDIIVRPGTALAVPPHAIVSIHPKDPSSLSAFAVLEYHEPISLLARSVSVA